MVCLNLANFFHYLLIYWLIDFSSKHENPRDGRINYVEFLNPYCPRRIREKPDDSIRQPGEGQQSSRIDLDETLMLKLKNKVKLDKIKFNSILFNNIITKS